MQLSVQDIEFDFTANTNPHHALISEEGKQQIKAETKNLLWEAQDHTTLVDAIEETYGWYVKTVKFEVI
tara:strand:+ start:730 stop:936 length:207 start_codon:yes stop_codon:yes gene_type:complete